MHHDANLWRLEPVENLNHTASVDVCHNDAAVARVRDEEILRRSEHFSGIGEEVGLDFYSQLGRDGNREPVAFGHGRLEVPKCEGDELHEGSAVTFANKHPGTILC